MSSPVQPLIDLRNKIADFANKIESYDTPILPKKRSGRIPTAKELGWADPPKKLTPEGPKLGGKKTTKKATKKQAAKKR